MISHPSILFFPCKKSNLGSSYHREQLEETNQELERTKKALTAKEDVERKQIEAVDQLTKTNQKLEKEVSSLKSQVDNLTSTLVTSQK